MSTSYNLGLGLGLSPSILNIGLNCMVECYNRTCIDDCNKNKSDVLIRFLYSSTD